MPTELIVQQDVLKGEVNTVYKDLYYFDYTSADWNKILNDINANSDIKPFWVEQIQETMSIQLNLSQIPNEIIWSLCFMPCKPNQGNITYLHLSFQTISEPFRFYYSSTNSDLTTIGLKRATVDNLLAATQSYKSTLRVCPGCG